MSTWRGHGGAVTVKTTDTPLGVGKWEVEEVGVLANKTNSTSNGHKQRQFCVADSTFLIEMPWDDTTDPAAIGIRRGTTIKLVLNKGESGKKITCNAAIIEKTKIVNDEDEDIVRLTISGYFNEDGTHS